MANRRTNMSMRQLKPYIWLREELQMFRVVTEDRNYKEKRKERPRSTSNHGLAAPPKIRHTPFPAHLEIVTVF
uniref:Ovule protein n=1 Tax=Caenorhabditis tropicalis TaxID=1561998 RepID=A0A1I7TPD9_9PELO